MKDHLAQLIATAVLIAIACGFSGCDRGKIQFDHEEPWEPPVVPETLPAGGGEA